MTFIVLLILTLFSSLVLNLIFGLFLWLQLFYFCHRYSIVRIENFLSSAYRSHCLTCIFRFSFSTSKCPTPSLTLSQANHPIVTPPIIISHLCASWLARRYCVKTVFRRFNGYPSMIKLFLSVNFICFAPQVTPAISRTMLSRIASRDMIILRWNCLFGRGLITQ